MHARALVRALVALAIGATLLAVAPAYADDVDPQAPVVVNDSVTLWPLQAKQINVLANDTDPTGDDLTLCWLQQDLSGPGLPTVMVQDASGYGAPVGTLAVTSFSLKPTTVTINYSVCSHTRVTPATLTITVQQADPVVVEKIAGRPGRVRVTNENEQDVRFWYGAARAQRPDGKITIPGDGTRVVHVQRHNIVWIALIGRHGIADHGRVRGIELDGPALPAPHHGQQHGGKGDLGDFRTARRWVG